MARENAYLIKFYNRLCTMEPSMQLPASIPDDFFVALNNKVLIEWKRIEPTRNPLHGALKLVAVTEKDTTIYVTDCLDIF
jgi:hypothetical protein